MNGTAAFTPVVKRQLIDDTQVNIDLMVADGESLTNGGNWANKVVSVAAVFKSSTLDASTSL